MSHRGQGPGGAAGRASARDHQASVMGLRGGGSMSRQKKPGGAAGCSRVISENAQDGGLFSSPAFGKN